MTRTFITLFAAIVCCFPAMAQSNDKTDYQAQWENIEELAKKRLPQSALIETQKTYQLALSEKEYGQVIKSIIYRMGYQKQIQENIPISLLDSLRQDEIRLPQPARSIVYSLMADVYRQYYRQNHWNIRQRTANMTVSDDINTWGIDRLFEEIRKYNRLSIQNEKILQKTSTNDYNAVVKDVLGVIYTPNRKEQILTLPTLYDLLVFKIIQSYNRDIPAASPQQMFLINHPAYFADARTFSEFDIPKTDILSVEYQVISLYQKLLRFRLQQPDNADNRYAFANIDIERLRYIQAHGQYADGESMYEEALKSLIHQYEAYTEKHIPMYALATLYRKQAGNWRNKKDNSLRPKYRNAYELCQQMITSGDTLLVKNAKELQDEIRNPSLILRLNYSQYPGNPILAYVSYRNISKLHLYIYRLTDEAAVKYHKQGLSEFDPEQSTFYRTQVIELPSQPDYQQYSSEIKINDLPRGIYAIFASDISELPQKGFKKHDGNLTTGILCQVSTLSVSITSGNSETSGGQEPKNNPQIIQVRLTDSKTGEPIKNGKIDYYYGWDDKTNTFAGSYTTDIHGITNILQEHDRSAYTKMTASHGNERFLFYDGTRYYPPVQTPVRQVVFFTDRSIYRPGQTVYYKAMCFDQQQLVTDFPLVIEFKDVNRKIIASQKLTTGEFGTVQGSFTIPQGILNGSMSLVCKIEERDISTSIRVEEYKRPTFEVAYDTLKGNYRLNDSVHVSGKARTLSGYSVDHARLTYRVVRNEQPRERWWWVPPVSTPQREIAVGTTVTGSDGSFMITFKAEADDIRNDDLIYNYSITADITDVNGETRSATQVVKISKKPLLIEAKIPEKIIHRDSLDFEIITTNLNGDHTPADVSITLSALKGPSKILRNRLWSEPDTFSLSRIEFEKYFPLDMYDDESNPEKYSVVRQLNSQKLHTGQDKYIRLSDLKTADAGWYKLDIKARNADGIEVEEQKFIQLTGSPNKGNMSITNMTDWLTVVKNKGEPGENVEFLVAGGNKRSFVYYEILLGTTVIEQKDLIVGTNPERITIPIKEEYRGGFTVNFLMTQNQRLYMRPTIIHVPFSNKQLDVRFTSFRKQLEPGEKEKWTLTVRDKLGEKETAEMVATLYDASLNALSPHSWANIDRFHRQRSFYSTRNWRIPTSSSSNHSAYLYKKNIMAKTFQPSFPQITPVLEEVVVVAFGKARKESVVGSIQSNDLQTPSPGISSLLGGRVAGMISFQENGLRENLEEYYVRGIGPADNKEITEITTRQNFNETAFFYPQLRTDENGEITIEFTIPEALTRWKMLGFAHTKDFKVGNISNELITQKQVAISANAPRFFRGSDVIEFSAKVNNITGDELTGQTMLRLYDATNMQPVDAQVIRSQQTQDFRVKAGESTGLKWILSIPAGIQAITYQITAQAGNHTDGEEKTIPVLTNSMLVTESMPFSVRGGTQKEFTFNRLKEKQSNTLRHHRLILEFTSNPAWYAVQAMPYMMEYPYECAEQVFTRFYANSLAATITNSSPRIKQIFDLWRALPENKEALLSNLEKNQELKQVMLEETPWAAQATSETERKKQIGLLFDLNRMGNEQQRAFSKLQKMQLNDGGFPWFDGLPASRFITQHIIAGIEHLKKLNALDEEFAGNTGSIISLGLTYLDDRIKDDYEALMKINNIDPGKQHITPTQLHHLYACSFSEYRPTNEVQRRAFDFYLDQSARYWTNFNLYSQAMAALVLNRYGDKKTAGTIIRSLKERALQSEEMGMYWKDNKAGYFWHQAPVETQTMLIEAFNEVASDQKSVEEMKIWLLRNKQTNNWRTTKATAEACYVLLMTGNNLLDESRILDIKIGGKPLSSVAREDISPDPGTGYVKTSWNGNDIQKNMASLEVNNSNESGIAWGSMYWQYFEQLDKITNAETSLKMNKQLFLKRITERGAELLPLNEQNVLKIGDIVTVRMELRADRDYEYIHLKDMRAAALEPVKSISGYRYQDGLWYYESIKDASTNFFISYLRKGSYVFEYELRVTHAGQFSNGITTFQCMYAPEFNAHSEGVMVKVE
ncbi:MAG: hypothetical protein LBQ60_02520 [Bacteroidales bacterium]|jgi:hypothetical protein|nr:hypothetical protein [Bacteroidales bacterium]